MLIKVFTVIIWNFALGLVWSVQLTNAYAASSHIALVIGNSNYKLERPLKNPKNDAQDIASALTDLGYDVDVLFDGDFNAMRSALDTMTSKAERAEVAIIYFAGHGIEIRKENYLIPVNTKLESASQVNFRTIPLELMTQAVSGASKLQLVMLDACRNNPFLKEMRRKGGAKRATLQRGLALPPEDVGATLISFAAKEGTTASDGDNSDRNSPYAAEFLKYAKSPKLDIGRMFRNMRDGVLEKTNQNQEPVLYGALPSEDVFLRPSQSNAKASTIDEPPQANHPLKNEPDQAKDMWLAVQSSNSIVVLDVLISEYPKSIYAKFAQAKIKEIRENQKRIQTDQNNSGAGTQTTRRSNENQLDVTAQDLSWKLAMFQNLDLFGADIYPKGLKADSFDRCSNQCGQDLSCRAFTWNQQANRCFLKTGFSFAQTFEGATAGLYFRGRQDPRIRVDWHIFDNSDLGGVDLGKSGAQTYESCIDSCQYNNECKGFAFVHFTKKKRQCWLKAGSVFGPIYNANARRGITSGKKINQLISPYRVVDVSSR